MVPVLVEICTDLSTSIGRNICTKIQLQNSNGFGHIGYFGCQIKMLCTNLGSSIESFSLIAPVFLEEKMFKDYNKWTMAGELKTKNYGYNVSITELHMHSSQLMLITHIYIYFLINLVYEYDNSNASFIY